MGNTLPTPSRFQAFTESQRIPISIPPDGQASIMVSTTPVSEVPPTVGGNPLPPLATQNAACRQGDADLRSMAGRMTNADGQLKPEQAPFGH